MAKRYAVLQKKLEELEAELKDVFSLPTDTSCHELDSETIERRFTFLRSLITAEMESHPSNPHHLHHIEQRLTELETAFHLHSSSSSPPIHVDTASTCSCTESCLNDDGGEDEDDYVVGGEDDGMVGSGGLTVYENPEFVVEDEKKEVETSCMVEMFHGDDVIEEKRGRWSGMFVDGLKKWAVVFGLGSLGVMMMNWICYACYSCRYKEDTMEMEITFVGHDEEEMNKSNSIAQRNSKSPSAEA